MELIIYIGGDLDRKDEGEKESVKDLSSLYELDKDADFDVKLLCYPTQGNYYEEDEDNEKMCKIIKCLLQDMKEPNAKLMKLYPEAFKSKDKWCETVNKLIIDITSPMAPHLIPNSIHGMDGVFDNTYHYFRFHITDEEYNDLEKNHHSEFTAPFPYMKPDFFSEDRQREMIVMMYSALYYTDPEFFERKETRDLDMYWIGRA